MICGVQTISDTLLCTIYEQKNENILTRKHCN